MEFKLPVPTLNHLSVLAIAHHLMDLKASDEWATNWEVFLQARSKLFQLDILEDQKHQIWAIMKATYDHLHNWYVYCKLPLDSEYNKRPNLHFNVHGCVDEKRMARDHLDKCYLDEKYDNDLKALKHLLRVAAYYALLPDIHEILLKILKLRAEDNVIPQLQQPEFEINKDEKLRLVYRFVNEQGAPMTFNVFYFDPSFKFCSVRVFNSCVCITLNHSCYNLELFQSHWNLLRPSKRVPFAISLLLTMSLQSRFPQVVSLLNLMDSDIRCDVFDSLDGTLNTIEFLRCFLTWPFQPFLLPTLRRVTLMGILCIELFRMSVKKMEVIGYKELLMPLWDRAPSEAKTELTIVLTEPTLSGYPAFHDALRKLSTNYVVLYERVIADLQLPTRFLRKCLKRKHESSSSSEVSSDSDEESDNSHSKST